jgi:hypothetical protein
MKLRILATVALTAFLAGKAICAEEQHGAQPPSWTTTDLDDWFERDSLAAFVQESGLVGILGASRSSDQASGGPTESIGVIGLTENDKSGGLGWALYGEAIHQSGASASYGLELAVKNRGSNLTRTPYTPTTWGAIGIWLAGGGDASYGGSPANPSNAAVAIGANGAPWNVGIVFDADGLSGNDGTTGSATAIAMPKGDAIAWYAPSGTQAATIGSSIDDATKGAALLFANDEVWSLVRGSLAFKVENANTSGAPANYLRAIAQASGSPPALRVDGSDTDIDLKLVTKGNGVLRVGSYQTITTETLCGFITIKDSGGTARKLAVVC